jgi:Holliday junction resolvase RusA-like endonuclease
MDEESLEYAIETLADDRVIIGEKVISIVIPGTPTTKLRPRFARCGNGVKTYDPQSEDKETTRWQIKARMKGAQPIEGPFALTLLCVFKKPKSKRDVFHITKPDLDNLVKWIGDVGNGVLWVDDKQIVNISASKIYGDEPRTVVTVSRVLGPILKKK